MARVKYDESEIMSIVISVLHNTMIDLYAYAYKIALQSNFADLQHYVHPEDLDQEAIDLVESLDDPLSLLIMQCATALGDCATTFSIIHNYDIVEFQQNEALADKAAAFYNRLSFYCAARGQTKGPKGDLYRYTFCVDHILYHLCRLIIFKYRDVKGHSRKRYMQVKKVDFTVLDRYQQTEVGMLVELAGKLDVTCDKIVAIVGKGRRKRII